MAATKFWKFAETCRSGRLSFDAMMRGWEGPARQRSQHAPLPFNDPGR
jgi:hypothetical protein